MVHEPTRKRILLVRHAQAEHNVASDWEIPDAPLTKVGRRQAGNLHAATRTGLQATAELLVTSPMRRALETTLVGLPNLKERLEVQGKPTIVLDLAQEVGDEPCDVPLHPVEKLAASNDGMFQRAGLDFSTLSPDYASKKGVFDPDNTEERARQLRQWLRARPEREIVLVAHGDILRYLVDGYHSSRRWEHCAVLLTTFETNEHDWDARLVEVGPRGIVEPTRRPNHVFWSDIVERIATPTIEAPKILSC